MRRWLPVLLTLVTGFAAEFSEVKHAQIKHDLDEIGRVATAMVDGDVCQRIVTERAREHMFRPDPQDPYAAGDNYDVNDQAFNSTKKTLIRLATLADYPVDVNLWMPLDKDRQRIHIVVRNRYEMSQFWEWGKLEQPMFPTMRSVLESGKRLTIEQKQGYISVLAPVRNSLGDVVGLVEVVSQMRFDVRENVK